MRAKSVNVLQKVALCVLSVLLLFVSSYVYRANATTLASYPFRTGENAFRYGKEWNIPTQQPIGTFGETCYLFDAQFVTVNKDGYFAIHLNCNATPGVTFFMETQTNSGAGVIYQTSGGTPTAPGAPVYFVNEAGEITELNIVYGGVSLPSANANGMLIVPVSSLTLVTPGITESNVNWARTWRIGILVDAYYNYGFSIKLGECGYYADDFRNCSMTKLSTLNNATDSEIKLLSTNKAGGTFTMIENVEEPTPSITSEFENGETISYQMRTEENAFAYGAKWSGVEKYDKTDVYGYETLYMQFASGQEMSKDGYVAFQMQKVGSVDGGFQMFIEGTNQSNEGVRFQTFGGEENSPSGYCYFADEDGVITVISIVNGKISFPSTLNDVPGTLILPIKYLVPVWGSAAAETFLWDEVKAVGAVVHAFDNYGFTYIFGEVGYYEESPKVSSDMLNIFPLRSDEYYINGFYYGKQQSGKIEMIEKENYEPSAPTNRYEPNPNINGYETFIKFDDLTSTSSYKFDENGTEGVLGLTKDTYGKNAMTLKATQRGGDGYTVPYIYGHLDLPETDGLVWAGGKGVMLWAQNLSNGDAGFNFEFDVRKNGEKNLDRRTRFNLAQGARYYTYDLRTGVENLCQARPTVLLPKDFYGWVFIPFSSFTIPNWSIFNGPNSLDLEKVYVFRIGISINQKLDLNKTIAFNNIGIYKDVISISTSFKDSVNGIENMYFSK